MPGAKTVFVSTVVQMEKVLVAAVDCSHDISVVVFDPPVEIPDGVISWDDFLSLGAARATGEGGLGISVPLCLRGSSNRLQPAVPPPRPIGWTGRVESWD